LKRLYYFVMMMIILLIFPYSVQATENEFKITNVEVIENSQIENPPTEIEDECFIATAAYGSKYQQPVTLLREFRDRVLLNNSVGTGFVEYYYKHSPPIANYITDNLILRFMTRVLLIPLVIIAWLILNPLWLIVGFGINIMVFRIRKNTIRVN